MLPSDGNLFLDDDPTASEMREAAAQAAVYEEQWKRDFHKRLLDAIPRFTGQKTLDGTRHCSSFKTMVTEEEAYAAEVRQLSVTAVQLLAVSSTAPQLKRDMPYFKADYVEHFVRRKELQGRTNDEVGRRLGGVRGDGGRFWGIYNEIIRSRCKTLLSKRTRKLTI